MDTQNLETTFPDGRAHSANARKSTGKRSTSPKPVSVTIIGAGPYGLSLAAHLHSAGTDFRIIGTPMQSWRDNMPKGMQLKSTGFSSTLYDPDQSFTIRRYCEDQGIAFEDVGLPVKLETFTAYGLAFQKTLVPNVEETTVTRVTRHHQGFALELANGQSFTSRSVVVGIGLDYFRNTPAELAGLPKELVTHSADHHDLSGFKDKDVAVIGGGSSAIDTAVLLHETGAKPLLISRKPTIEFGLDEPLHRPLMEKLYRPMSGIGPGWQNRACTDMPWAFRYLPDHVRMRTVKEFLGPAGGWFMKERMELVPRLLGHQLRHAHEAVGKIRLHLSDPGVRERTITVDHVIAATGYRQDVSKLPFIASDIIDNLDRIGSMPRLSANFESSIRGLYFIGPITANTFGPVMRFSIGAGFTSRRLSRHLAKVALSTQRSLST